MLIVCPHCATSYRVDPENFGETGRSVRCVNCQGVWFEEPRRPAYAVEEPEPAVMATVPDPSLIRPPLNDVVEIGLNARRDEGGAADGEDGGDFSSPEENQTDAIAVEPGPSIIPADDHADERRDSGSLQNVESFAARRPSQRPRPKRRWLVKPSLPVTVAMLALIVAGLLVARHQVVRYLPQTASLYALLGMPVNLRGLTFDKIRTTREIQDGVPMLVVEGDIVGTTGRLTEVPRLRFAVLDHNGKEIYAWTARPERSLLPPGETLAFRSRLASPPAEASGVTVRFFNRRDAQAGFM